MTFKAYIQRNKKILKPLGYTTIGLWVILIITFSLKTPTLQKSSLKKKDAPDFQFEKVTISQINGINLEWQLDASSASIRKHKGRLNLSDVTGIFYKDNQHHFTFKSPSATLLESKGLLIFDKTTASLLTPEKPIFIKCNSLQWNAKKKAFYGKGDVQVYSQDIYISGKKLFAGIENKKLTISKKAIAEIKVK
tara:strand:+ start:956 stop:1534 length:579 start_codon:yes stop_codon:yes gene_type:complete